MRRKAKTPIAKAKDRIQKLLTAIVRVRDGGCIFRDFQEETQKCSGWTAADHIISRKFARLYGLLKNVVCACQSHHIFYKQRNPIEYTKIVEAYMGTETIEELLELKKEKVNYQLSDWLKVEEELKRVQLTYFS